MWFLCSKLIPIGVWNEERGDISYNNMMEHLDKHCGVDWLRSPPWTYESSEDYVIEAESVAESALDTLMEAWNKDPHGKQIICSVGGARSARPIINYAIYFLLTRAQDEADGEKMMERTPAEETLEGNNKTLSDLSDGTVANTFV
jgi:hypothetical protein